MTFDELWARVEGLPDTAKMQVPEVLAATKKKLMKYSPAEIEKIVAEAIREVDHGSIETLDNLVRRIIK